MTRWQRFSCRSLIKCVTQWSRSKCHALSVTNLINSPSPLPCPLPARRAPPHSTPQSLIIQAAGASSSLKLWHPILRSHLFALGFDLQPWICILGFYGFTFYPLPTGPQAPVRRLPSATVGCRAWCPAFSVDHCCARAQSRVNSAVTRIPESPRAASPHHILSYLSLVAS